MIKASLLLPSYVSELRHPSYFFMTSFLAPIVYSVKPPADQHAACDSRTERFPSIHALFTLHQPQALLV
jgi:hypothetical protein